ncbi:MAG: hypothetical protein MJZ29_02635 [Bacteroidaceae bacterium]|nr:hypothetical protein [Bacteroidaceae bacterium]
MQTATFDAKKLSLMELVMAIKNESVLDKVLGYASKKVNESNAKMYDIAYEEEPMMLQEETVEAIKETRSGEYAGTLDMTDFDSFLKSIDEA